MAEPIISESNRVALYIAKETDWGETPAAATLNNIRYTSESLGYKKDIKNSSTVRSDYQRDGVYEVGVSVEGSINVEFRATEYNTLVEALMRDTFTAISKTATTIGAVASGNHLTDSGDGLTVLAGFVVGAWIKIAGFTAVANNGIWRIASRVSDGDITLDSGVTTWETEAATASITITGNWVRNGTDRISLVAEKQFLDITKYAYVNGLVIGGGGFSIPANDIVTASFNGIGKNLVPSAASVGTTLNAATSNSGLSSTSNVGTLLMDGSAIAASVLINGIDFTIDGGLRTRGVVATKYTGGIGRGEWVLSGTIKAWLVDWTLYDKLIAHTNLALSFRLTDVSGNVIIFTIPKLYFADGNPMVDGTNSDELLTLAFEATNNGGTGSYTLQIDQILA